MSKSAPTKIRVANPTRVKRAGLERRDWMNRFLLLPVDSMAATLAALEPSHGTEVRLGLIPEA